MVQGRIDVEDEAGRVVAREAQTASFGGGETRPIEVGGVAAVEDWARELTGSDTPDRCGHLYWLVSPVEARS